jgi:hypothetical protein
MPHSTRTKIRALSPETQRLIHCWNSSTVERHGTEPDDDWLVDLCGFSVESLDCCRRELRGSGLFWCGVRRVALSRSTRAAVWDKTAGRCWYCDEEMHPFRTFTIDHERPVSRGGGDELDNLVPCCKSCNSRKRDR